MTMKFQSFHKTISLSLAVLFAGSVFSSAQDENVPFNLETITVLETMPVKNQARTGTCWSFATTSFIESELIRMGKGHYDLSEMFFSRHAYESKAELYVRYHSLTNFGPGGQAHDVMNVIRKYGFIPDAVYHGIHYGSEEHNHSELHTVLNHFLDGVLKARQMTPVWDDAFRSILDTYYGEVPQSFEMKSTTTTTVDFSESLGFNPDDYVEITSYMRHPYYSQYVLEVPDNWSSDVYYNVPLDEFMEIIDHALINGFTVAWDGDVSDRGFASRDGLAIVPAKDWNDMSEEERENVFKELPKEKKVDMEMRQLAFDDFATTDDHLMHITGLFEAPDGRHFYLTKNSHGADRNDYGGFIYMSEAYVRLGTIAIMVHKDAIPETIMEKLGL